MRRRRALRWGLAAVAAVIAAYVVWSIWDLDALMGWMERARPLPFFTAMALLPVLGVPPTPLYLLAGASFGLEVALVGTGLALVANLALAYAVGRWVLGRRLAALLERFAIAMPAFDEATAREPGRAVRFAALVKLTPGVPIAIKNFVLGAAQVPFAIYLAISLAITGTYAAAFIVVGESLLAHELGRGAIALAAAATCAAGLWWWSRRRAENAAALDRARPGRGASV